MQATAELPQMICEFQYLHKCGHEGLLCPDQLFLHTHKRLLIRNLNVHGRTWRSEMGYVTHSRQFAINKEYMTLISAPSR